MKLTAMFVAVMLPLGGLLFVGCSFNIKEKAGSDTHGSEPILPEVSLKEEKAAPLPQPDQIEADSPKAAKVQLTGPKIYTIKREKYTFSCDTISCGAIMPPPLPEEDYSDSIILSKVEIEAEYPGGAAAWQRFLNRNLRYPQEAIDNEISGSVVVQFVVDEEGNVSNVEKVNGPESLGAEAVRVIRKSGKWTPAVQGGRCVRSLKKQPFIICFAIEE